MRALPWLVLAACSGRFDGRGRDSADSDALPEDSGDSAVPGDSGDSDAPVEACPATPIIEIVVLDAWGRDLPGARVGLDRSPPLLDGAPPGAVRFAAPPVPLTLQIAASAEDHSPAGLRLRWDGATWSPQEPSEDLLFAWSEDAIEVGGLSCAGTRWFVGLRRPFFAASAPAPSVNEATLAFDGEEMWAQVAEDLAGAERRVTWSTWWWDSDHRLLRGVGDDAQAQAADRLGARMDALADVEKRVLVNRFWDENLDFLAQLNTDLQLRERAEEEEDGFEVILQGNDVDVPLVSQYRPWDVEVDFAARVAVNPRYDGLDVDGPRVEIPAALTAQAASWHQKAIVIDGEIAWIHGLNSKTSDWDTTAHRLYEPRRMRYGVTAAEIAEVQAQRSLPDDEPRKDFGLRLVGPIARDTEAYLHRRWEDAIAEDAMYAENATPFSLDPAVVVDDGVLAQVTVTLPPPFAERSLLESHLDAIARAEGLIVIEDQYFRSMILMSALVERMVAHPELRVVVATLAMGAFDGGAQHTHVMASTLSSQFPGRFLMLEHIAHELVTGQGAPRIEAAPIFTHSKLRIVDDLFLSIGSGNVNNRGYLYEGEMNATVVDADFVRAARQRVLEQWVGAREARAITGDPAADFATLQRVATANATALRDLPGQIAGMDADAARRRYEEAGPSGFIVPLATVAEYEWDVGPDAF